MFIEKRSAQYFENSRIRMGETIHADDVQPVRRFGSESELMQIQSEVARRLSGLTGLRADIEYTFETMRLGAIQGIVLDADGSVLFDWFQEFNIPPGASFKATLLGAQPSRPPPPR